LTAFPPNPTQSTQSLSHSISLFNFVCFSGEILFKYVFFRPLSLLRAPPPTIVVIVVPSAYLNGKKILLCPAVFKLKCYLCQLFDFLTWSPLQPPNKQNPPTHIPFFFFWFFFFLFCASRDTGHYFPRFIVFFSLFFGALFFCYIRK